MSSRDGNAASDQGAEKTLRSLEDVRPESTSDVEDWTPATVLPNGALLAERYRIVRFISRGGMGEVYEVEDLVLGDRIALKTVASVYLDSPEALDQLKAEVQLARKVSHKNVCRIFDIGTHPRTQGEPLLFLTMEYIDGQTLGNFLADTGAQPVEKALRIAKGILEGLQAAHEAGVLHRDLKSDNVMLRARANQQPIPVLMDFGLASALNPNSSRISSDQALVGSLAYMAPEQVQGDALRVATDLYAFGVILFEMLTGRLPFEAATPALSALKRLQEDAPPLSQVTKVTDQRLEQLVARCLERDPKQRFASAEDILRELSELEAFPLSETEPLMASGQRPVLTTPDSEPPPSPRRTPRPEDSGSKPALSVTDLNLVASGPHNSRRRLTFGTLVLLAAGVALGAFQLRQSATPDPSTLATAFPSALDGTQSMLVREPEAATAPQQQKNNPSGTIEPDNSVAAASANPPSKPASKTDSPTASLGDSSKTLGAPDQEPAQANATPETNSRTAHTKPKTAGNQQPSASNEPPTRPSQSPSTTATGSNDAASAPSTASAPPTTSTAAPNATSAPRSSAAHIANCPPGLICPDL